MGGENVASTVMRRGDAVIMRRIGSTIMGERTAASGIPWEIDIGFSTSKLLLYVVQRGDVAVGFVGEAEQVVQTDEDGERYKDVAQRGGHAHGVEGKETYRRRSFLSIRMMPSRDVVLFYLIVSCSFVIQPTVSAAVTFTFCQIVWKLVVALTIPTRQFEQLLSI
jgi:hypothetical protein